MVFIRVDHVFDTINALLRPQLTVPGNKHTETMCFEIVFTHDEYTHFVTHIVEKRIVRIVTRTNCRNIVFLTNQKIFIDEFRGNGMTVFGMEFVTIYPSEFNGFCIQQNKRSFSILKRNDFYLSESEINRTFVNKLIPVQKRKVQSV